ncbi:MAG TPA: response regulator transcription factor [Actinomycetota bacterium]
MREGLAAVLSAEPDFTVVGQAESAERALVEVDRLRPDVVLLDIRLPGMSGTEACTELLKRHPGARVIVLTSFASTGSLVQSFSAGAKGFVLKESQPAVLRDAVRTVARGDTFTDPRVGAKLVALASRNRRAKGPFGLTIQEMRVIELLPRGLTNREIGGELGISEDTVKTHVRHALRKLNARDRVEAAAIALREGLA